MTLADDYISAKATISVSYAYIHATDTEKLMATWEAEHYFDFDNVNVLSIISLLIISNR